MRRIKGVRKDFHKLVMKATQDYYGYTTNKNVMEYIEGKKVNLTEEEKSDVWKIRNNIGDKIYTENLLLKCV